MGMVKSWLQKYFGEQVEFRERLLRIILFLGFLVSFSAVLFGILSNSSAKILIPVSGVSLITLIAFLVVVRYKLVNLAAVFMVIVINGGLFPAMYFQSGGIHSGSTLWFVLGLVYLFLLFSGKTLVFFTVFSVLIFSGTYYLSYTHPEWVVPMESDLSVHIDSLFSVVAVGLTAGALFKFQQRVFERERRRVQEQQQELEDLNRSQNAFFANMSHEIRTPINTIIGLNEMILREENSEETLENALNIQSASQMLLTLVNDILDMSKIESGKMDIVPVEYETGAMFDDLVNMIWVRAHDKGLELLVDIAKDLPSRLYGDEIRIKQVLSNILTNAVKYTESGTVTLTVKGEQIGEDLVRLQMAVEDTGIGIKKEDLKELFSVFRRVDQKRNRNIEGTGLGLSISKQLVEMMGGEITVDSIYRKGSTFTVVLNQKIVDDAPIGEMNFMVRRQLYQRKKYQHTFEAPDAQVLIVDDNEMNLMVAKKLLRATKVRIDVASSGAESLEMTNQKNYNVIFMDYMMPEMDGEEAMRLIRQQENGRCQETPIIALTANVMDGAEKMYQARGFDDYLAKPVTGELFEAMLLKYLPEELVEYENVPKEGEEPEEAEGNPVQVFSSKRKKRVSVMADCACDLPEEWLERYDIGLMYNYVHTGTGRFNELREISPDGLLNYIGKEGNVAYSSAAPVEEYESFFANALTRAEKVVYLAIASQSGEGYAMASAAAQGFGNVFVIDSGQLSGGLGIMALYAAQMAQKGFSAEEIRDELLLLKNRISTTFMLPSLDTLYRCGKIGKNAKTLCDLFSFHPVLHMSQNRIRLKGVEMGSLEHGYRNYVHRQLSSRWHIDPRILVITYVGCPIELVDEIRQEAKECFDFDYILVQKASATISSNSGTGAIGLMYMKKGKGRL